jgi:AraC-like DNA-binding protein
MDRRARQVLLLHADPLLREGLRLFASMRGLELRLLADWVGLHSEVGIAAASALIVVDPYHGNAGQQPSIELAALLNRFPSASVVAAMAAAPGRLDHIRRLGEWGVVQIIDLEEETRWVILGQRLLSARGRPLRALVDRMLPAYTSGAARAILAAASTVVVEGGQGRELARALHITPRTLSRWCRRGGLPPPRQLLVWLRVLLAAELLDDPGRTVSDVALSCGYAADASLRLAIKRFVGQTPTELREQGAFDATSRVFLEALAEARFPTSRYRARSGHGKQV